MLESSDELLARTWIHIFQYTFFLTGQLLNLDASFVKMIKESKDFYWLSPNLFAFLLILFSSSLTVNLFINLNLHTKVIGWLNLNHFTQ